MATSSLRWVVAITTALIALEDVVIYALQLPEAAWDSPAMNEYLHARNHTAPGVTSYLDDYGGVVYNFPESKSAKDGFRFLGINPKAMLIYAMMVPLSQYWNIWLEKRFPARPFSSNSNETEYSQVEKRSDSYLTKQGSRKPHQRPSLSKRNTLVKLTLDVFVWAIIYEFIWHALYICLMDRDLALLRTDLYDEMYLCASNSILSMAPLIKFIAFLIIPAQRRVVFTAASDLLRSTFFWGFLYILGPYATRTQFGQFLLYVMTDELWKKAPRPSLFPPHYFDEL